MMSTPIIFNRGEKLAASKMNNLSAQVQAGQTSGNVQQSKRGALIGTKDGRNYIEPLVPFDVERFSVDSVIVRGGSYEYYLDTTGLPLTRSVALLTCDDGPSADPFEFKTLSVSGIAADTEYSVYLDLNYATQSLAAKVVETTSYPAYDETKLRVLLTTFTTNSSGVITSFDPVNSRHTPTADSLGVDVALDDVSINSDDSGAVQIYAWNDADNTATLQDSDLFPLQVDDTFRALDYVSAYSLAEYIAGAIDWSEYFDLDEHSLDYNTTSEAQLAGWETAVSLGGGGPLALSLVPIKEWDGAVFDDVLAYYTIDEILANSSAWLRGGTSATNYGSSIGSAAGVTEIDLAGKSLTGNWATDGDFNLSGAGKVYKAQGSAGVTGDGFTGGIKTDDTAMRAAIESQVQDILAGVGGLL